MTSISINFRYQSILIGGLNRLILMISINFRYRFLSISYVWLKKAPLRPRAGPPRIHGIGHDSTPGFAFAIVRGQSAEDAPEKKAACLSSAGLFVSQGGWEEGKRESGAMMGRGK